MLARSQLSLCGTKLSCQEDLGFTLKSVFSSHRVNTYRAEAISGARDAPSGATSCVSRQTLSCFSSAETLTLPGLAWHV